MWRLWPNLPSGDFSKKVSCGPKSLFPTGCPRKRDICMNSRSCICKTLYELRELWAGLVWGTRQCISSGTHNQEGTQEPENCFSVCTGWAVLTGLNGRPSLHSVLNSWNTSLLMTNYFWHPTARSCQLICIFDMVWDWESWIFYTNKDVHSCWCHQYCQRAPL